MQGMQNNRSMGASKPLSVTKSLWEKDKQMRGKLPRGGGRVNKNSALYTRDGKQ